MTRSKINWLFEHLPLRSFDLSNYLTPNKLLPVKSYVQSFLFAAFFNKQLFSSLWVRIIVRSKILKNQIIRKMRFFFLFYTCAGFSDQLYSHSGVLQTYESNMVFINTRETSTMLNIRFTLDIGKNEPQEKVKNPCHKSDGDYSEQFRYLIRKQISEN